MIRVEGGVLIAEGEDVIRVANALASETRLRIIKLLQGRLASIEEIAKEIGKSKADISMQVKILEDAGLVEARYVQGQRGMRKLCTSPVREVVLRL